MQDMNQLQDKQPKSIEALNRNVLLKDLDNENKSESGMDLTSLTDKNQKIRRGMVVSVGESCPEKSLSVGDVVAYDMYRATNFYLNGEFYVLTKYDDLAYKLPKAD